MTFVDTRYRQLMAQAHHTKPGGIAMTQEGSACMATPRRGWRKWP
jgi:hypothetical protein